MDFDPSTFAAALAQANGHPDPTAYAERVVAILEKPEDKADEGEQHV